MKKLLLVLALFFSTSILVAQGFNQPSQFNNVCDDNNDGYASFFLGEISFEILGNLNAQDYVITHHETQNDATTGFNALPSPYTNIYSFTQTVFVRIVTVATSDVTILTYSLNVNPTPIAPTQTVTNCANVTTGPTCWNIAVITPGPDQIVTYYRTQLEAQFNYNQFVNPTCYSPEFSLPPYLPVYYRIESPASGCFAVGMIELVVMDCQNPNCPAPIGLTASISSDVVTLDWEPSIGALYYTVMFSVNGGAMQVAVAQQDNLNMINPQCNSTFNFSVSAFCDNSQQSAASEWITFNTGACEPQPGQPVDLRQCVNDNGVACFDFVSNDIFILNDLNPSEYTLTYHATLTNAENDTNTLIAPYCVSSSQPIYARLENNANQTYQIFGFSLTVDTVSDVVTSLNNLQQCDDNNDSIVTFDLTAVQAQINSTNVLEYYPSLANAQNQVVPFDNPSALNIGVQNQLTSVFVREIVLNGCDNIYILQLQVFPNCNTAYTCSQANSLCNSLGTPFQNTTNLSSTGTYGCLFTTPNPTWFYLPISQAGTINLLIQQGTSSNVSPANLDADFVIFGPFTDPVTPCSGQLTANNIAGCSYSSAATEIATIPNAQPGQFYLLMVTNFSNQSGYIKISEVSGSTGAIDCSGLKLNAFLDSNNNGAQDNGEQNFPLGQFTYEINNNGNVHNIVSPTGIYNIYDTNGTNSYDLSYAIDPNYTSSYSITTSSYSNVNVVIGGGMQVYNFPITITQPYNDLAVNIIPVNSPRPGFNYMNKIVYTNNGNQTIAAGTVTFNHDPLLTIFTNTQSGTTPITNGFSYSFTNLLPFESREMTVNMQVPTIPTVTLGGLLTNTASIVPLTGDVVPANNSATNTQIIIGAYDPNDKMEAHGERILHSTFTPNDYLTYTIRFENTGTAEAINVRVNDVLNSQLDLTSIRMISASHSYIMDRIGNNINWYFDNIMLPPSIANTNIGKGYITFMVKPLPGYAVGDIIPNTASIYFDFNPAIVTNTFNTEFVQQLGLGEFENADFVFYPNPVSDIVTITVKYNGTINNIAVYDVLGKMIIAQKPSNSLSTQTLDLSTVSKGMYLLEVSTDTNLKVVKKLIVE
jgi:uncharacterized repeat protein (TIGR01451 family)